MLWGNAYIHSNLPGILENILQIYSKMRARLFLKVVLSVEAPCL